jgi:MoxR-like ATPase
MKPSAVKSSLKHLVSRQRPAFIWGLPGAGKSDVVAQTANELGIELRDVRLNLMDPVDLKGFPVVKGTGKNQQMGFVPPDFLPTKGEGILFLDEMNSAPQSVQAAAYGLILNRRLGDYELPKGWSMLAAGNRSGDRGVVNTMPSPLANRLVHIDFEVDVDDWFEWATVAGISDVTRAFVKFRPNLLHSFNPSTNERAFPTPRSWQLVDDVTQSSLQPDIEYELIKGTVGEGAAAEYLAFSRTAKDLPSVEEILLNPDTAPIPNEPAGKYAVCTMLDRKTTPNTMGRMLQYVERMTPEFQVLYIKSAVNANRALTKTKEFIGWVTAHQDVLL